MSSDDAKWNAPPHAAPWPEGAMPFLPIDTSITPEHKWFVPMDDGTLLPLTDDDLNELQLYLATTAGPHQMPEGGGSSAWSQSTNDEILAEVRRIVDRIPPKGDR